MATSYTWYAVPNDTNICWNHWHIHVQFVQRIQLRSWLLIDRSYAVRNCPNWWQLVHFRCTYWRVIRRQGRVHPNRQHYHSDIHDFECHSNIRKWCLPPKSYYCDASRIRWIWNRPSVEPGWQYAYSHCRPRNRIQVTILWLIFIYNCWLLKQWLDLLLCQARKQGWNRSRICPKIPRGWNSKPDLSNKTGQMVRADSS